MNRALWLAMPATEDPSSPCMVRVTHYPNGVLFPEGPLRDFSAVHRDWHEFRHVRLDGRETRWSYRFWDPYSCYGAEPLPHGQPLGRAINNLAWVPSQAVLARMIQQLTEVAGSCQVIWWDSAIQCFPQVAQHLKRLFRLAILNFGDDLPGSSECKTFPVASCFDVLLHAMYTRNFKTGESVPAAYAARGLKDCRFIAWGPLNACPEDRFERKVARLHAGNLPLDLVWLGNAGISDLRRSILLQAQQALRGRPAKFFGHGMPAGWWSGAPMDLYDEAVFGVNIAESSLFNGRFADLCVSGTIQIACDPYGELRRFGFVDGVHFLAYDGSPAQLLARMATVRGNGEALASMARAARDRFMAYRREYGDEEVQSGVLLDYERQVREGR